MELEKKLAEQFKNHTAELDKKMEALEKAIEEGKGIEELKSLKTQQEEAEKNFNEIQKQMDSIAKEMKENKSKTVKSSGFRDSLLKAMNDNADKFNSLKSGNIDGFSIEVQKADMVSGTNFVGDVVEPHRVPGVVFDPTRRVHVREMIPGATTSSSTVEYTKETAYTDGSATISEGAVYPQSDFVLTQTSSPVRKLGAKMDMSLEMFDDKEGMSGYINTRLTGKAMNKEDQQLLYGDGVLPNLTGISTAVGNNFTGAGGFVDYFANGASNYYDVLKIAANQIELVEYMATAIFLNPSDHAKLVLTKDAEGQYIYPSDVRTNGNITVAGIRVVKNTAVTSGDFFIGDFSTACQIFQRKSLMLEFSTQNVDNFEKDMITVKVSERLAFPFYRDNAFVYDTFAAATLVIEAA